MQINAIEYFEKGALRKCRDKVAVVDQTRSYTFEEIERFAKNCAALILKKAPAMAAAGPGVPAEKRAEHRGRPRHPLQRQRLRQSGRQIAAAAAERHAAEPRRRRHHHLRSPCWPRLRALEIPEERLVLIEQAMVAEANL